MKTTLNISDDLSIPPEAATETFGIVAIRGAGKTYTGSVLAEEMLKAKVHVVIVDPTGVWWGLRSSSDGKHAGHQVIVMGGNHGDVPLEEGAGEVVADFVVDEQVSVVLDLSLMRKAAQVRFMTAFAEHLYHRKGQSGKQTPLHLFLDEADRFAPQKPRPEQARLLGAMEDIVRLGRVRGFGITMITQRTAVIAKDVFTQIETLVILRTPSPQDRKAIDAWVEANATEEEQSQVAGSLASLPNGTAWFWSPSWLKLLRKVRVRARETYNSSATPKLGETRAEPKKLADVDLNILKGRIAQTIEKAKANDPRLLQAKIVGLETKLTQYERRIKELETGCQAGPDIGALRDAWVKFTAAHTSANDSFKNGIAKFSAEMESASRLGSRVHMLVMKFAKKSPGVTPPAAEHTPTVSPVAHPRLLQGGTRFSGSDGSGLTPARQRILDSLSALERMRVPRANKSQLAFMAGQSPTSSGYANNLGALRSLGLISYPSGGEVCLTESGRDHASGSSAPTTSQEVQAMVLGKLMPARRRILEVLLERYPSAMSREELAEASGQSASSSGYANNLGALRTLGVLDYPERGQVAATDIMFMPSVSG